MDVITPAFAVASAAATATLTIAKVVIDTRGLKDELTATQVELRSIERIVFTIADLINDKECVGRAVSNQLAERLLEDISQCQVAISDTSTLVNKYVYTSGVARTARWLASGKDELNKLQARLAACKLDLDLMLNLLNLATKQKTSQVQKSNTEVHREVRDVMMGIQSLQDDHTKMLELLVSLKTLHERHTNNPMLERFIDSLTDYAETACERTILDTDEMFSTQESEVSGVTSGDCDGISEFDKGVRLQVGSKPTAPPSNDVTRPNIILPSRYRRASIPTIALRDASMASITTSEDPTQELPPSRQEGITPASINVRVKDGPLLVTDPTPRQPDSHKHLLGSLLMGYVYNHDAAGVKHILSRGADPNTATVVDTKQASRCSTSVSPLLEAIHFAIKRNTIAKMISVVDVLLGAGASPLSPVPCSKGHKHMTILSESINILSRELHHGLMFSDAPYHSARYQLMPIILQKLIKHGADPDHKEEQPLMMALRNSNPAIVEVLARHGATVPKMARWDPSKSETDLKLTASILRNINIHRRTKKGANHWLGLLIKGNKSLGATVLCGTITALTTEDHMSFAAEFLLHAVEQMILCGADPRLQVETSFSRSRVRMRLGKIRWSVPVFESVSALELVKCVDVGFDAETVTAWKAIRIALQGADCHMT